MTISVKHKFVSAIADEGDTSLVRPSNWNDTHDIELATARLIGRTSSGTGAAEEISVGTGLNLSSGSLAVSSTTPQVNSINTFTAAQVIEVTDNSNPALRITQLGTADALRIEDETSPDATPFVITSAGHAIAGYGSTLTIDTVVPQFQSHTNTLDEGGFGGVDWGNTATGQVNWFGKSRGGSYGSQAIVQSGDTIGDFRFYGSDGTSLIPAARLEVAVDGTPGTNDMPGRFVFYTTVDGASTVTERLRISNSGVTTITGTGVIDSNSSSAALRITQVGSGNALLVEDSANPDSTPFVVNAAGSVGVGATPLVKFQIYDATSSVLRVEGDATTLMQMYRYSADTNASSVQLYKGRGTKASPSLISSGDFLGSIFAAGHNGSGDFNTITRIDSVADTVTSGTSMSSSIRFGTANAAATATERFRIGPAGQLGIGGANYGTSGQVLTSGGASAAPSWSTPSAAAGGMFYENDITLTSNYTISTNKNAMTAGPVTINSGVTVTVPSGSTWTIV